MLRSALPHSAFAALFLILSLVQCLSHNLGLTPPTPQPSHSSRTLSLRSSSLHPLPPPPNQPCACASSVTAQTGITLSRFMLELARQHPELVELESIFASVQTAVKTISKLVKRSAIDGMTGYAGGGGAINVQGEEQKKLDVITNDVLKRALKFTGRMGVIASEEEDAPVWPPRPEERISYPKFANMRCTRRHNPGVSIRLLSPARRVQAGQRRVYGGGHKIPGLPVRLGF